MSEPITNDELAIACNIAASRDERDAATWRVGSLMAEIPTKRAAVFREAAARLRAAEEMAAFLVKHPARGCIQRDMSIARRLRGGRGKK